VEDYIGFIHQLGKQLPIGDGIEEIAEARVKLEMANIFNAAGGEIVQHDDIIAAMEKRFSQMGADESGSAGN